MSGIHMAATGPLYRMIENLIARADQLTEEEFQTEKLEMYATTVRAIAENNLTADRCASITKAAYKLEDVPTKDSIRSGAAIAHEGKLYLLLAGVVAKAPYLTPEEFDREKLEMYATTVRAIAHNALTANLCAEITRAACKLEDITPGTEAAYYPAPE